ncbi:MAG: hypothetical protein IJA10_08120 [Lachnospiraceae bacterium]|nr:hypothetical protein [Lachnospiraceae bacterium]
MKDKILHIIIAYVFHIVFIVMSFAMMQHYHDALLLAFIVLGILYLIYWIMCNRKSYMPWNVYGHFGVGVVVQVLLNTCGIVSEDGGLFSGLGQFFYVVFVVIHAVLVGLTNLILYVIHKKRKC